MSFCRECGKEVQDDWITCPFCSQDIGPPASNTIGLQDSVVMGDVSINDASTKCVNCESTGVTQITCSKCKVLAYCNICESEIKNKRLGCFVPGRGERSEKKFLESIMDARECEDCFTQKKNKWMCCDSCKKFAEPVINTETCDICGLSFCYECFDNYDKCHLCKL